MLLTVLCSLVWMLPRWFEQVIGQECLDTEASLNSSVCVCEGEEKYGQDKNMHQRDISSDQDICKVLLHNNQPWHNFSRGEEIFMSLLLCSDESEGYCYYSAQERPVDLPWITYVVITEVGLKLIPSVALATINWNLMQK